MLEIWMYADSKEIVGDIFLIKIYYLKKKNIWIIIIQINEKKELTGIEKWGYAFKDSVIKVGTSMKN